jgi:putative FmdB family regulatory protein
MPLFEYRCTDCAKDFEKIVPRHDSPVSCPNCASLHVEKQLSVFAVSGTQGGKDFDAPQGCGRCGAPEPGMCQM